MITLFIDTNVFLSFFHLTNEDLEELKKLSALIEREQIQLLLPKQIEEEFLRNRGAKIADALRKLRDAKFNLSYPLFVKEYPNYLQLRDLMHKADKVHAELIKEIEADAACGKLMADGVVSSLFNKAKKIETHELYLDALKRVRLGNPPGKESSMGDAICWECLLKHVPNGTEIFIVSGDKDYRSHFSEGSFNEFLMAEWTRAKASKLNFYTKISDFFKERFPTIKIASEVERDLLIQQLAHSGSFASTHTIISKLLKHTEFSAAQVEQLADIPDSNSQVGWIVGDPDVREFYANLCEKYASKIHKDAAVSKLQRILDIGKAESEPEDVPF